mmetsp:Transcript_89338/g.225496  ORF Transcript_89338/g.225496 Transcript_89338/m.225496 type:complete len:212 (-) Transcript_89338:262-897(-)
MQGLPLCSKHAGLFQLPARCMIVLLQFMPHFRRPTEPLQMAQRPATCPGDEAGAPWRADEARPAAASKEPYAAAGVFRLRDLRLKFQSHELRFFSARNSLPDLSVFAARIAQLVDSGLTHGNTESHSVHRGRLEIDSTQLCAEGAALLLHGTAAPAKTSLPLLCSRCGPASLGPRYAKLNEKSARGLQAQGPLPIHELLNNCAWRLLPALQ